MLNLSNLSNIGSLVAGGVNFKVKDIEVAFSLRLVVPTYTGNAIKIRRESDNAEQDIAFVGGLVDVASAETFCSGTNGYVVKIYNQKAGKAGDALQETADSQPLCVENGVFYLKNTRPAIKAGVGKFLSVMMSSATSVWRHVVMNDVSAIPGTFAVNDTMTIPRTINRDWQETMFTAGTQSTNVARKVASSISRFWKNTNKFVYGYDQTVYDADNNAYTPVIVGNQVWTTQNMRYLPEVFPSSSSSTTASRYYVYGYQGTDVNEAKAYEISGTNIYQTEGVLYNWYGAMQGSTTEGAKGICPAGWHIPTDAEQYTLENYLKDADQTCNASRLGAYDCNTAGTKLKVGGTSGFNGILSGLRLTGGTFGSRSTGAFFWSSSESGSSTAWRRALDSGSVGVDRYPSSKAYGFSVRCLKD